MKIECILCNQVFEPDKMQVKKIAKHPHKIQICSHCKERITKQVEARRETSESQDAIHLLPDYI